MILLFLACVHQPVPVGPAPLPTSQPVTREFGGARWGFVQDTGGSGRLVVLGRLPAVDGGPGPEPRGGGHHGEIALSATSVVIDTVTGEEREIEALVSSSADGRWLVVLAEGGAWLLDDLSGAWTPLDEGGPPVDLAQDENRCLPPRTASFADQGARVAYLSEGGVVVRDLPDGAPTLVPSESLIWRAWPRDEGVGLAAFQVGAEVHGMRFPWQRTSCACYTCMRFSMSYGFYGWGGPDFTGVALTPDSAIPATELPKPYGSDAWIISGALIGPGGATLPTPEGCTAIGAWPGAAAVQLDCGGEAALWIPEGQPLKLGLPAEALPRLRVVQGGAAPSLIAPPVGPGGKDGAMRLIHLDTLAVVPGPSVIEVGPGDSRGVVLALQGEGVIAWDTVSGEVQPVPLPEGATVGDLGEDLVHLSGGGVILVRGAQTLALPRAASAAIDAGCVLVAAGTSEVGFDLGPWRWTCLEP